MTSFSRTDDVIDPAGAELAMKLRTLEDLIDQAYAAAGELASATIRARMVHNLSAVVGQPIFYAFDEASSAVVAARGHVVRGHRLLEQLGRRMGIPVAYGDSTKDDDDKKVFTGA